MNRNSVHVWHENRVTILNMFINEFETNRNEKTLSNLKVRKSREKDRKKLELRITLVFFIEIHSK